MKTLICPNCGCSLVRLGIRKDEAVAYSHESKEYFFCCDGCLEQFLTDITFQLAEVAIPRCLFTKILRLIDDLRPRPAPA